MEQIPVLGLFEKSVFFPIVAIKMTVMSIVGEWKWGQRIRRIHFRLSKSKISLNFREINHNEILSFII